MAILDCKVTGAQMVEGELRFRYTIFVTKNIKVVSIYYEWWQNDWVSLDYSSYLKVPKNKRKLAINNIGVSDVLAVNGTEGKLRATVIASNILDEAFGSSVVKTEVLDIGNMYKEWIIKEKKEIEI